MKRGPVWDEDETLRAEASQQRAEAKTKPNGHDREGKGRIELVPFDQMQPNLRDADLVAGLLGSEQLSSIVGVPGCGKTFMALDIGLHVAAGIPWFGRRVRQGVVVYVAAEAGRRIFNRVAAWRDRHRPARPAAEVKNDGSFKSKVYSNAARQRGDGDGPRLRTGQRLPFYVVPQSLDLCTADEDLDALIAAIQETCGAESPRLIVIDTLSRVMAGGNENGPEDMGAVIAAADRLRDAFKANVCLIHHLGKDASRGGRGHSSLIAAVDTEIQVSRDEDAKLSTAKVTKQRDGETGEKVHFALDAVTLGENEETGDPVTSCIVIAPDAEQVAGASRPKRERGKAETIALDALRHALEKDAEAPPASAGCPASRWVSEETWRVRCYAMGISSGEAHARRMAFRRASDALVREGLAIIRDGHAWTCGT